MIVDKEAYGMRLFSDPLFVSLVAGATLFLAVVSAAVLVAFCRSRAGIMDGIKGNYSLHDAFRQKGLWWHPSDAEQQVFGEIIRTPNSISLEVGGSDEAVAILQNAVSDGRGGLLHGVFATKDNNLGTKKVTLVDVLTSNSGSITQVFSAVGFLRWSGHIFWTWMHCDFETASFDF